MFSFLSNNDTKSESAYLIVIQWRNSIFNKQQFSITCHWFFIRKKNVPKYSAKIDVSRSNTNRVRMSCFQIWLIIINRKKNIVNVCDTNKTLIIGIFFIAIVLCHLIMQKSGAKITYMIMYTMMKRKHKKNWNISEKILKIFLQS